MKRESTREKENDGRNDERRGEENQTYLTDTSMITDVCCFFLTKHNPQRQ